MADAEDLKSSGDFSSCGFDSHPGHQFLSVHLFDIHRTICVLVAALYSPSRGLLGNDLRVAIKEVDRECLCFVGQMLAP